MPPLTPAAGSWERIIYAARKSLTLDISAAKVTSCAVVRQEPHVTRKERVPEVGDSWPHLASGPASPRELPLPTTATWLGFKPKYEAAGM